MSVINLYHGDCLEAMREMQDKAYSLAICDPPYGIDASNMKLGEGGGTYRAPKKYKRGNWDKNSPETEYFNELRRVSENQILWGANHYISKMPVDAKGWIVWDKNNGQTSFADAELAWSSFDIPVRIFKFTWSGYIQDSRNGSREEKIHPTQKPVGLYKWLLTNYAKQGDTILDTHGGSMSIAIAAYDMGFDLALWEIDKDYYDAGVKRFNAHKAQTRLFAPQEMYKQ